MDIVSDASLEDISRLEQMNVTRVLEVKRALLDQQKTLMTALHKARETAKNEEEAKGECGIAHESPRCCPMCEAAFPEEQVCNKFSRKFNEPKYLRYSLSKYEDIFKWC